MSDTSVRRAPLVSVVIPCLNEAAHLPGLLESLLGQDTAVHEVIVVDNGSTDGSRDIVANYQRRHADWSLRLLTCPTAGAAAAMNVGIEAASGGVSVRLAGHCVPRPDYVRRAVDALQQTGVGVVGGVWDIAPVRDTLVARAIVSVLSHPLATGGATYRHADQITAPKAVDTVPFGCYRRSLWSELGGYDERLQVNEDYVFNYKARLAGWSVVLDPAIRSTYVARETLGRLAAQYYQYGWRKADMLKTYPRAVRWRQVVPGGFTALLAVLAVLGLFSRVAWLVLGGVVLLYLTVLAVASGQLAWSRRVWRATPAYIAAFCIVQLAWGIGACVHVVTLGRWRAWSGSRPMLVPREDWTKR